MQNTTKVKYILKNIFHCKEHDRNNGKFSR